MPKWGKEKKICVTYQDNIIAIDTCFYHQHHQTMGMQTDNHNIRSNLQLQILLGIHKAAASSVEAETETMKDIEDVNACERVRRDSEKEDTSTIIRTSGTMIGTTNGTKVTTTC
jgi:uncharacterized protein YpiB (UPF0302 family)